MERATTSPNNASSTANGKSSTLEGSTHSDVFEGRQPDLVCFSHLRWHFVTQRPQHLLMRAALDRRVFYWEEPIWHSPQDAEHIQPFDAHLEVIQESSSICVIRPHLSDGDDPIISQKLLLSDFMRNQNITDFVRWYYTPMALPFSSHLSAQATIYDCMDELSGFLGAPPELKQQEIELFEKADIVFTGGVSLYESKKERHANVYCFPSSIDRLHFATSNIGDLEEPSDQRSIPNPRAGFYGVVDERFDVDLLAVVASMRPEVHFVVIGPVVKIDQASLPQAANIHYLGSKTYQELPSYLAGWDVALLPFALNESTRFISPTKTPEYLAGGKPVVSTPIHDIVRCYGESGLIAIADSPAAFAEAIDSALVPATDTWKRAVDEKLSATSWDSTWREMHLLIDELCRKNEWLVSSSAKDKRSSTRRHASHSASASSSKACFESLPPKPYRARRTEHFDYIVVGAGFAGSVIAERLATKLLKKVLIVDKRDHIAGNAFDHYNEDGILVHKYGPHIFHTNSQVVVDYLSQFTAWRPYEHRVLSSVSGSLLPVPINLDTINRLYNLNLDAKGMKAFLDERAIVDSDIRTSEQIVLSRVGRELYELFFRNYTRKQWGLDPSQLDASVAGRIPIRFDHDDRYFNDSFQAMPFHGFTAMFERILDQSGIKVRTSTSYEDVVRSYPEAKIIYTGPIDEYFGFRFGPLPYRSLEFKHETHDQHTYQSAPVINYPNNHEYTRITEFKYLTGQIHEKTSIVFEYPRAEGDPYYPIPRPENTALFQRYKELAGATENVLFCGRLANYRYFNMDQVVAQALTVFDRIAESYGIEGSKAKYADARPMLVQSIGLASA